MVQNYEIIDVTASFLRFVFQYNEPLVITMFCKNVDYSRIGVDPFRWELIVFSRHASDDNRGLAATQWEVDAIMFYKRSC